MSEKQPSDPCWDCYSNVKICTASMSGTPSAMAGPIYELAPVGNADNLSRLEAKLANLISATELVATDLENAVGNRKTMAKFLRDAVSGARLK